MQGLHVEEHDASTGIGFSSDGRLEFSQSSESMAPCRSLGRHQAETGEAQDRQGRA